MIDVKQLRECVIRPPLKAIGLYSLGAEELLIATASVESRLGTYIKQEGGPALGIYQMEPTTFNDLMIAHIRGQPVSQIIMNVCGFKFIPDALEMITNMKLATLMARLHYYRFPEPMPEKDDTEGLWKFYKKRWNTNLGDTTEKEFMVAYNDYSGSKIV